jgi:hypothetical protein
VNNTKRKRRSFVIDGQTNAVAKLAICEWHEGMPYVFFKKGGHDAGRGCRIAFLSHVLINELIKMKNIK